MTLDSLTLTINVFVSNKNMMMDTTHYAQIAIKPVKHVLVLMLTNVSLASIIKIGS